MDSESVFAEEVLQYAFAKLFVQRIGSRKVIVDMIEKSEMRLLR
jgi:hypothetical protein